MMNRAGKWIEERHGETVASLLDFRFARLLGFDAWTSLPPAIRRRFSQRVGPGSAVHHAGRIEHTRLTLMGRLLANLLRPIGAPLPLHTNNQNCLAAVIITEGQGGRGQCWTRRYARPLGRAAQTITSTKGFAGPTGCEEWVTPWLGMALDLRVDDGTLYFESRTYRLKLLGRRVTLPACLSPGLISVGHSHINDTAFRFTLTLTHPWFGCLVDQAIVFSDDG